MKISLNNINNYHTNQLNTSRHESGSSGIQKQSKNFDAIIIKTDPRQVEERNFATTLSQTLSEEIRQTSSDKIASLTTQVANGTYTVDPDLIASKMLLLREER